MNKATIFSLSILLTLFTHGNSWGFNNTEKIYIDADRMKANIESGHSVYTGNVKVRQGKLLLTGDKIIVQQRNNEVELITVFGKPAHYNHVTEEGEIIKANSEKMVYTASKNQLVLTINARLNHPEHKVSSQKIVYNTLTKVAIAGDKQQADSHTTDKQGENERVRITLTPKPQITDPEAAEQ